MGKRGEGPRPRLSLDELYGPEASDTGDLDAEASSALQARLVQAVQHSLAHYLLENALFLAERLHALAASDYSAHVLATVHYRAGRPRQARRLLEAALSSPENRFLYAWCCHDTDCLREADQALCPKSPSTGKAEEPTEPAQQLLLAMVARRLGQKQRAVRLLRKALAGDASLFQAYLLLCELGEDVPADYALGGGRPTRGEGELAMPMAVSLARPTSCLDRSIGAAPLLTPLLLAGELHHVPAASPALSPMLAALGQGRRPSGAGVCFTPLAGDSPGLSGLAGEDNRSEASDDDDGTEEVETAAATVLELSSTPTSTPAVTSATAAAPRSAAKAPRRKGRKNLRTRLFAEAEPQPTDATVTPAPTSTVTPAGPRQTRARAAPTGRASAAPSTIAATPDPTPGASRTRTRAKAKSKSKGRPELFTPGVDLLLETPTGGLDSPALGGMGGGGMGGGGITIVTPHIDAAEANEQRRAVDGITVISEETLDVGGEELRQLLVGLGEGYRHLSMYRCRDALAAFDLVPSKQYMTGWTLNQVGKAHLELVEYQQAKAAFEHARRLEPYRTEGAAHYSTVLWHMRKEVELSYLAHELVELDRLSPETWCAVGNCFSLQKEHDKAVKMFSRALQVDPTFCYAYTLSGHEYIANAALERATACFRSAIHHNDRHYNAWYGLGLVFYRQEKNQDALVHFKRALKINASNSVLHCYLGMVLQAQGANDAALRVFDDAIRLDPKNNMAKFRKASSLVKLGQFQEALAELERVKENAPKEAQVYFSMGKIYKMLGQLDRAIVCLTKAMDLDAKNTNYIKSVIDKLDRDDAGDDLFDL